MGGKPDRNFEWRTLFRRGNYYPVCRRYPDLRTYLWVNRVGICKLDSWGARFAFHNDYNVTERRRGTRLFNNFGRHGWLGAIYVEHYFR